MGFGNINMFGCGIIATHAEAKQVFEDITPIKGDKWDANWRPLRRSSRQYWLIKDGEDYTARLYSTDVIRWKPDGTIIIDSGGYQSRSTASFISVVAPFYAGMRNNKLWLYTKVDSYYVDGKAYRLDPVLTTRDGKVLDAPQQYKLAVNRQRAKELRTSFKPFLAYAQSVLDLIDVGSKPMNMEQPRYVAFDINDEGTYYCLFYRLLRKCNYYRMASIKEIREALWHQMYEEADCYDKVPVPMGVIP